MGQSWTNKARKLGMLCAVNLSLYLNCFAGVDQGEKKVTLNVVEESCVKVFKQIEKQTKMSFFYSTSDIRLPGKVSISVVNAALDEVMGRILEGTGLEWVYTDNIITIRKKKGLVGGGNGMGSGVDSSGNMIMVTGKVTQADGTPIPGATVRVKRTGNGVTTDVDGYFFLPQTKKNDALLVSSIGYETREISVKGNSVLIKLNLSIQTIEETVVKGYYTTTKRLNTGNVTTVTSKEIEMQPISNPLSALQGRVPGMFITQNTGLPGGGFNVQIRGRHSIENGNDPFYIIDGVPYTSRLLPNRASDILQQSNENFTAGGNPLSFINPADIESITILKDADATAIYGSRGANGVVLITTKKGKSGKLASSFRISSGISKVARKLDLLDTKEYMRMRKEAFKNDGIPFDMIVDPDIVVWDTLHSIDWQKRLIGGTAHYTDIQSSLSGGTDYSQFLVSGNYHKETTVFPGNSKDQKGSVHFSLNSHSANRKLNVVLSANYTIGRNTLPPSDFMNYIDLPPNTPEPLNSDGSLNWADGTWPGSNPYAQTKQIYKSSSTNLISNLTLTYNIVKGLNFINSLGYTNLRIDEVNIYPISSQMPSISGTTGFSYFTNNNIRTWIAEPQMTYTFNLGEKGKFEALLGTTFQQNNSNGLIQLATGYTTDALLESIQAASNRDITSMTNSIYKYNAVFGRINVNWDNKYILNLTARRDGSSRFGRNNKFQNFGSGGIAWIFSEEKVFKDHTSIISFGKLRASYGTTGSDQIGDYRFYDLFSINRYPYQGAISLNPTNLNNPNLAWEETKKMELGVDIGLLKDKIHINGSYYRNRSSNQLLSYNLPSTTGFTSISDNLAAKIQNTGWEVALSTDNIKSTHFSWKSSFNITIPKNKLLSFPGLDQTPYQYLFAIGQPITLMKLFRSAGVNDSSGVYDFYDNKGNKTSVPDYVTDNIAYISRAPRYYGGLSNSISFRGFQLDILLQFTKQTGYNPLFDFVSLPGFYATNVSREVLKRWQKAGDKTPFQKFTQSFSSDAYIAYLNASQSDLAYTDASFIRLKNLSISYHLPTHVLNKLKLDNCRIYLQAQNLFTITGYRGIDPETQLSTVLPPLRVLTAGLELTIN